MGADEVEYGMDEREPIDGEELEEDDGRGGVVDDDDEEEEEGMNELLWIWLSSNLWIFFCS